MNAEDRVALILGRAIMRAEALQTQLDAARQRIAELDRAAESSSDSDDDSRPAEV